MRLPLNKHIGRLDRFMASLYEPVSAQSLAVLRMAFGLIMAYDVWRFFHYDRIHRYYVEPEFWFTYYGFGWVKPLPDPYIHYAWFLVGVLAVLVAAGLFYRMAIVGFTLLFSYFFLLHKAQYLNHFYMVILFAGLLCLLPAHRAYPLDAILFPRRRSETVPRWSVWALRTQTEIILIYAGLVKITEDWLKLEPLGMWLRRHAEDIPFGQLLYYAWVIALGAYGTIALHLVGAPMLLFRRTRLPTFIVYCCFHLINAFFFNIGVFPWLTIAVTTIFFAPNWPQLFARWLLERFQALPPPPEPVHPPAPQPTWATRGLVGVLVAWMALQVLIPLRLALYPGEVRWAGEGHRFAWRMRMYDRKARGYFEVVDPQSGERWDVEPTEYLTDRQARIMLTRPDMILQFAHYLESVAAGMGYGDVKVYAHVEMSLNGREYQPLVEADVDLTTRHTSPWRAADYITELTTPFTHWIERQSASYDGPQG
ncbi:MAG TPA: HTTM domain-containing protein [Propylenella sp.]